MPAMPPSSAAVALVPSHGGRLRARLHGAAYVRTPLRTTPLTAADKVLSTSLMRGVRRAARRPLLEGTILTCARGPATVEGRA